MISVRATAISIMTAVSLVACETRAPAPTPAPSSPTPIPAAPTTSSVWSDFYGIQYKAPAGADARITRSVLPGPGGLGGSPVDERPYASLSMAGAHGFHLRITKSAQAESLDGTKAMYIANHVGTGHVGTTTRTGWELAYATPRSDDPTRTSNVRLIYVDLGGGHYECIYDEQNCADPAAAEAICRSMRAKP